MQISQYQAESKQHGSYRQKKGVETRSYASLKSVYF